MTLSTPHLRSALIGLVNVAIFVLAVPHDEGPSVSVDKKGPPKAEGATGEDCYFELLLLK
jgi:hypothetical protein